MSWIPNRNSIPLGDLFRTPSAIEEIAARRINIDRPLWVTKNGYNWDTYRKNDVVTLQQITLSKVAQPVKINRYTTSDVKPIALMRDKIFTPVKE